jgi:membrane protein
MKFLALMRETVEESLDDRLLVHAAALAYYALFSLAPLMLITLSIAGVAFDERVAREGLLEQARALMGDEGVPGLELMLQKVRADGGGPLAGVIGAVTLLIGATGVFVQLKDSLNRIWDAPPSKASFFMELIRERILSFAMVVAIGFLLLISLILSAAVSVLLAYFARVLPGGSLWTSLDFLVSIPLVTSLFALIYTVIPDRKIRVRDVWIGAAFTAVLFTIGKYLIGLYIGQSALASSFGAAGSLVVVLVWIYYSALLVLFGAEFTYVHARSKGRETPELIPHGHFELMRSRRG